MRNPVEAWGGVVRKVDPILGAPKPRGPVALCSSGACGLEGPAENLRILFFGRFANFFIQEWLLSWLWHP